MNNVQDFLVEIGTEELPPKELQNLVTHFAEYLGLHLKEANINFGNVKTYATPRRLAVIIYDLNLQQPDQIVSKRGPAMNAAFNADGTPTKAALGFAQSCGVSMQQLGKQETEKGAWLYFEQNVKGRQTKDLLPSMVEKALSQLPVKKYMRWGYGEISFVRPIHWIVMLLGEDVIHSKIWGIETSNTSRGHRILCDKPIKINTPATYASQLENEGKIIADFAQRQTKILDAINNLAAQANGIPVKDADLLDMVTGLVEHPVALLASFDSDFLRVPKECLISAMQDHQKCFAIVDHAGNLLPKFILISNISSTDPQTVIRGNELVMHARLADAAFYYDKDRQQTLVERREALKNIIYVKKLGSLYDKTERIKFLAEVILNLAKNKFEKIDTAQLIRAAELCKADLLTNMVYEFPELQGVMGCYYALNDHEPSLVATAIKEHYQPKFAEDSLPKSSLGTIIALADRIDTIAGMFGIGNFPTGEKDPYGLRRQAIAILRLLIEANLNLDLKALFSAANQNYNGQTTAPSKEYFEFFTDRLKAMYIANGIPPKNIAAVLATISQNPNDEQPFVPTDIAKRMQAVTHFQTLSAAESLAAANKRVQNLLEKSAQNTNILANAVDPALLEAAAEKSLYTAIQNKELEIAPLLAKTDYSGVLQALAGLQVTVDEFFNHVMVMDPDTAKRDNRLNLLKSLRNLFLKVADVSLL